MPLNQLLHLPFQEIVVGTGTYIGYNEQEITLPELEAGCVFSATINGVSISIPFNSTHNQTMLDIASAISGVTNIGHVDLDGLSPNETIANHVLPLVYKRIRYTSSVNGALISISNVSLVCGGSNIQVCVNPKVGNLREIGAINVISNPPINQPVDGGSVDIQECCNNTVELSRGDSCTNPLFVKNCSPDIEKTILCDVGGDKILVEISYVDGVRQPIVYWNINTNSAYTGNPATDLVVCPDIELESDGLPYCLTSTNETVIGYTVKQNGEPTGVVYWTNIEGATIPAPATGTYTFGACTINQIRTFLADDLLSVDDVTQVTLTPPTGANLAEIQPQGIDLRYSFNGFTNGGKVISNFTRLELESLSEIVNVSFLSLTGTGNVHIDYFFEPNLINN